jgi:hypothetical protein
MRIFFAVLVVANLLLAGYALFAPQPRNPDAALLDAQLNADQIRVVPPRPAVIPSRQGACIEWGAFSAAELALAREAIGALGLGARVSPVEVQTIAGWWVYIPPLKSKADVERRVAELGQQGIKEYFAIDNGGDMNNAISLGIFKSEEAANHYLQALLGKGVRSAQVGRRDHRVTQTAFQVRNPDPATAARMAELTTRFPGSELKAKDCPG